MSIFVLFFPSRGEVSRRGRETFAGPVELAQGRSRGTFSIETGRREIDSTCPATAGRIELPTQTLETRKTQRQKGKQTTKIKEFGSRRWRWRRTGRRKRWQKRNGGREIVHGVAGNEFHALHQQSGSGDASAKATETGTQIATFPLERWRTRHWRHSKSKSNNSKFNFVLFSLILFCLSPKIDLW